MSQQDLHVKVEAEPIAYWFIIVVLAIFAAMCLFSFLDRAAYAGADEYFLLVMGLFGVWATYRSVRYFMWPNVSVTGEHLVIRRFWSPRTLWTYQGIENFETWTEIVQPKSYLSLGHGVIGKKKGPPLRIKKLAAILKDGARKETVLPVFNASLAQNILTALSRRSGKHVTEKETVDRT